MEVISDLSDRIELLESELYDVDENEYDDIFDEDLYDDELEDLYEANINDINNERMIRRKTEKIFNPSEIMKLKSEVPYYSKNRLGKTKLDLTKNKNRYLRKKIDILKYKKPPLSNAKAKEYLSKINPFTNADKRIFTKNTRLNPDYLNKTFIPKMNEMGVSMLTRDRYGRRRFR
jgi:hypothetical protein